MSEDGKCGHSRAFPLIRALSEARTPCHITLPRRVMPQAAAGRNQPPHAVWTGAISSTTSLGGHATPAGTGLMDQPSHTWNQDHRATPYTLPSLPHQETQDFTEKRRILCFVRKDSSLCRPVWPVAILVRTLAVTMCDTHFSSY